ncbi:MAG: ATP-binding cassette domain-containing protein [Firmicutes bacterium]|jgi:oligopeptide/dipeptide ABC transporter ATP-binding protein|nr:ATP-binding cassette domain-containing protein [Bacillota bacterium]
MLEVIELRKHFALSSRARVHAVDGVSFEIPEGETVGLVGESGCGKTTVGRCILRLIEPDAGRVVFGGLDILGLGPRDLRMIRTKMQIIFQDPYYSLDPRQSVYQIVSEPLQIHRMGTARQIREKVVHLLDQVGLSGDLLQKYPHELDGGRCQRVGIARALAFGPAFIVCDEPVSALDVSIQAQILNLLMDLQERLRLAYLFISHNLAVVKHISNRVMVMYLGKLVESAPTQALFDNPLHPYTQALLAAVPDPDLHEAKERILLTGDVPTPVNPGPGCRFAERCPFVTDVCRHSMPKLIDIDDGHTVACFRVTGAA